MKPLSQIFLQKNLFARSQILLIFVIWSTSAASREVTFCGEKIPVNSLLVSEKLMNVIRAQIPYANLPDLRRKADKYFPLIDYYLKATNLPADLKYIPIVESGFRNVGSKAGAFGFWQLMEATAREWGLTVNGFLDERNDINKSTLAACKELARLYKSIKRDYGISSWVLSAAAYNYGIGNMYNRMNKQGNDYFSMDLNPETAMYVYKIVAIKELFEFPELYMKNFQYNVFSTAVPQINGLPPGGQSADSSVFKTLEVSVNERDGNHPDEIRVDNIAAPTSADLKQREPLLSKASLVAAQIVGDYAHFKDGDSIRIKLRENIQTKNVFQKSETLIIGRGWIIGERVFVDLGFGRDEVILYDLKSAQGIKLDALHNKEEILLRVQN